MIMLKHVVSPNTSNMKG